MLRLVQSKSLWKLTNRAFLLRHRVIDPDKPYAAPDAVQIQLLRFLSLLVERASSYIHDPNNKRHGNKLRRIMTFAWPCLLPRNCVDPASKYHGHLLLSHIIAKFAIRKRIVLQTFYSLLKVGRCFQLTESSSRGWELERGLLWTGSLLKGISTLTELFFS